jgi:ubiquinone/menaquinone biosynthesis C-methylase UbiE
MTLATDQVADVLARHLPVYRLRRPVYQAVMLEALRRLWRPQYRRVLDIGGGTGVIAQAVAELFDVDQVVSIDVEDRFLPSLTIEHRTYDGRALPFADGAFDCVLFNNVIHHVEIADRVPLLVECRRVAPVGALLIKDHLAAGPIDHLKLTALDIIGNTPFSGMIKASYLEAAEWSALAEASGYAIAESASGPYRGAIFGALFPNRLETTMRWEARAA